MKDAKKLLALILALVMCLGMLAGCSNQNAENSGTPSDSTPVEPSESVEPEEPKTLVIGTQNFDGKFSPFFYTNAYENDVLSLVNVGLLGADREGAMVLKGIEGETRPYNGTDYLYTGVADCEVTENADGTVYYDLTLKDGVQFSDGTTMDIDDVIFSMYVYLDPAYDGVSTLYSIPIEGLDAYRAGMEAKYLLIAKAGKDNTDFTYWTEEEQTQFWAEIEVAGTAFAQAIVDYCAANGYAADSNDVATAAAAWGFDGLDAAATAADFFATMVEAYENDYIALSDTENTGASLFSMMENYDKFSTAVQTGESAPNVSGIQKTGDMSMRLVLTEVNANAIYQLGLVISPLNYYGDEAQYDYDNNQFGFPKGDLSVVKAVTSTPVGAGPYTFSSYENGTVTLEANPLYWKGEPKIKYVQFKEGQDADKIPGVVAGTLDITDPSYSKENADQIAKANGGELSGDVITTNMVANLGYGYVGICAKNVKVGDDSGSEASKNLRKAIATVIAVYRDVAIDSYYGEFANVINYPISDTSWAAPRVTDEGYKVAFSTDVNGEPIYTEGMTPEDKYAAAKQAALGYFEAAGYTVADGKVTAAPEGAKMNYEVMVGGGGIGDHPTFMALTQASAALKEIGFDLIVTDMSNFAELTNAVNAGTAEMFAMAWQATADPDMYQIYHSLGGSNEKSYWIKDAELDELIVMARQSTDQTYRKTLYKECLDIVADWAVEIPMYQRQNCIIFSSQRVNLDTVTPDITTFWGWANDIELLEMN